MFTMIYVKSYIELVQLQKTWRIGSPKLPKKNPKKNKQTKNKTAEQLVCSGYLLWKYMFSLNFFMQFPIDDGKLTL